MTRERILDVAWGLIEAGGEAAASTSAIARAAGLTRQAVYFHFADRAALLVALTHHIDERRGLPEWIARIEAAPDAATRLRRVAQMQAERNPTFATVARAIDGARHRDEGAAAAWRDQTGDRMSACERLLTPALVAEGLVHPSWSASDVGVLLWELTSFRVWDDLVTEAGLAPDRYVEVVTIAALNALASPFDSARG